VLAGPDIVLLGGGAAAGALLLSEPSYPMEK